MKTLLTITFSALTFFCFGQTQKSNNVLYNLTLAYRPAVITILADTGMIHSSMNDGSIEKMAFTSMAPGQYKIQVSGLGQQTVVRDSIVVRKGQVLVLSFTFNGPCLYDHPKNYIPTCPKNHTNGIIPIVYGFIATNGDTFVKDKKEMKVKNAGCVTTGCDPLFYCKEHDIEF